MFVHGFTDELLKLAKRDERVEETIKKMPNPAHGALVGAAAGAAAGIPPSLAYTKKYRHLIPPTIAIPAAMGTLIGYVVQKHRKEKHIQDQVIPALMGEEPKTAGVKNWLKGFVETPSGDMFASHVPFGSETLGALRAKKGERLKGALKGFGADVLGNIGGAMAGLITSEIINRVVFHGKAPALLGPGLIGLGGTIGGPLVVNKLTRSR